MKGKFILSCESTVDIPYTYMKKRNIPVIFYTYEAEGRRFTDDMGRHPEKLQDFYRLLEEGKRPVTAPIEEQAYEMFFEKLIQKGNVLHIAFGSGMSISLFHAEKAAEKLRKKYPGRKLLVIDSLCSCCGYGLLVDEAADMRDAGHTMGEVRDWLKENRQRLHHQFYTTQLDYYRNSGRMVGAAATTAALFGIWPILRLDDRGRIVVYDAARGMDEAIKMTVDTMEQHARDGLKYSGKCWIAHSDCPEDAEKAKQEIAFRFPKIKGEIPIWNIGMITASHCGPGTLLVCFWGDERPKEQEPMAAAIESAVLTARGDMEL